MNPFGVTIDLLRRIEATSPALVPVRVDEGLARAVSLLAEHAERGAQIFFIGNGASQSIASHIAADFLKNGRVKAMAFTDASLLTCVGNDLGFDQLFAEPLRRFGAPGDALVAISSSGRSPNVLTAADVARELGMAVVTVSGFEADNPLRAAGDINFWVPSDHYGDVEVVHGAICHRILDDVIAQRA